MNKITMNKIIFFLASVIAAVTFASEASALPVFARQTGMECAACHFQHFPLLNQFGRAFKTGGFTMIGAQAQVEGQGLSLPATVNAAVLASLGYEKSNATKAPGAAYTSAGNSSTGAFYVSGTGGEMSLFVGGRGSDFMGYLAEITLGGGAGAADSVKTPILFDLNGTRAGVVFFSTNGQGASYGFETLNTGANAVHSITNTVGGVAGGPSPYIAAVSAQQYINTAAGATGASFVAANDMGFINVTKFDQIGPGTANVANLGSTYLRLAGTFDLAGWDSAVGAQYWRGTSTVGNFGGSGTFGQLDTMAAAIDGQMQGALGSMPAGIYLTLARAPATTATSTNAYNGGAFTRSSVNLAAELGVVPDKATVGAAVRRGKSGVDDGTGANAKDNAIYLTATYKLAQNILSRLSYVHQSGNFWTLPTGGGATNATDLGTNTTTVNLYALF